MPSHSYRVTFGNIANPGQMDTNILLFKTQSKISSICTYQVPEADSYIPFIVCMWGYFSKPWTRKEPVWKMQQTSGKKPQSCAV